LNLDDLKAKVYSYTKGVMDTLKLNGVIPNWVQIGNETNNGMLWPDGKVAVNSVNNLQTSQRLLRKDTTQ